MADKSRLPLPVMTGEQAKLLGGALGVLTAPMGLGLTRWATAIPHGWEASAASAYGTAWIVLLTVLVGGKRDPAAERAALWASDHAARLVEAHPVEGEDGARQQQQLAARIRAGRAAT